MFTALLILAALLVLVALVVVVGQMCECGSMWFFHVAAGTPNALLSLLCFLASAVIEVNRD